jgi:hypothetical protein
VLSGSVTNNGWTILNHPDDTNYSTVFSGSGTIEKRNAGVGTISGANGGFTGTFAVNGGVAKPTNSSAFGSTSGGTGHRRERRGHRHRRRRGHQHAELRYPRVLRARLRRRRNGVIQNNPSAATIAQQNAFQRVHLLGDATFGGSARLRHPNQQCLGRARPGGAHADEDRQQPVHARRRHERERRQHQCEPGHVLDGDHHDRWVRTA